MLRLRLISGIVAGLFIVLSSIYSPQICVWFTIVVISIFAQLEFYAMLEKAKIPVFKMFGIVAGTAMISVTFFSGWPVGILQSDPSFQEFSHRYLSSSYKWENIILLVSIMTIFIRQFPQKHNPKSIETISGTIMGLLYVPFLFNYITRLALGFEVVDPSLPLVHTGKVLVLYLLLVVKTTDIGAYFTGKMIGRHKMFPRISPGKTWEGLIGGVILSVTTSYLFLYFNNWSLGSISMNIIDALVLGLLLSVIGVLGDLFESLIKRTAGIKDSGRIIPGMGGLLDIMDSVLFGAPILYCYLSMFKI